jgi:predicted kinase
VKLIITVGLPGSGKSTYLARLGVNSISSDEIRRLIADDPLNQTMNARVFATVRYLVRQRLASGRPLTYVDATHLTPWERKPYVQLAQRYGCQLEALFFDVPVETCVARNQTRGRIVPESAILNMARRLIPPSKKEGFNRVYKIRPGNEPDRRSAPTDRMAPSNRKHARMS